jgi:ribose 5-phosphate isomerase B
MSVHGVPGHGHGHGHGHSDGESHAAHTGANGAVPASVRQRALQNSSEGIVLPPGLLARPVPAEPSSTTPPAPAGNAGRLRVALAADHRGFAAKERVKMQLLDAGCEVADYGTDSDRPTDYPDIAAPAAEAVGAGRCGLGILLCGSGIGVSITANKVKGVRAALCHDELGAELARSHNDANVLCLPADWLGPDIIHRMVQVFLSTRFEAGRHSRRVEKIMAVEKGGVASSRG